MHNILVASVRNSYSSTNVTTGAWVQLISSLSNNVRWVEVFDSSGQTLELGVGPTGSELRVAIIVPNKSGFLPIMLQKGMRVAIRAISGTANTGELDINFFY